MSEKKKYLHDEIIKLKKFIENLEAEVSFAKKSIAVIHEHYLDPYKDMPGIEGYFDGSHLVAESGEKFEVPPNYSAKTRIVYGDILKKVEEDGKVLFKNIEKKERKKLEAVVAKKDGVWSALTADHSYRISDAAAVFNNLALNDSVIILVPADNLKVPFAALDRVVNKVNNSESTGTENNTNSSPHQEARKTVESTSNSAQSPEASSHQGSVVSNEAPAKATSNQKPSRTRTSSPRRQSENSTVAARTAGSRQGGPQSSGAVSSRASVAEKPAPATSSSIPQNQDSSSVSSILDEDDLR